MSRIRNAVHKWVHHSYCQKQKKRLENRAFSVFSSNCVGGCVLHDLGERFDSPFVNLYMDAKDYLTYLQDPRKYNGMEFVELPSEQGYPVARLGDLTVHFVHYSSFDEAVCAFKKRCDRIHYDNLFVIFVERDGCTYEDLKRFDSLPYQNKVVFTHVPYEEIQSAYYIPGFEQDACLGNIIKWDTKWGRMIYDHFDFVRWFNGGVR